MATESGRTRTETCTNISVSKTYLKWTDTGPKPGFRGERLACIMERTTLKSKISVHYVREFYVRTQSMFTVRIIINKHMNFAGKIQIFLQVHQATYAAY